MNRKTVTTSDHESESTYHDRVYDYLVDQYGVDNVDSNVYLSETYRFVDIWVEGPVVDYAIEIENDFESAIEGIGQAALYASHEFDNPNVVPIVVLPPDHVAQPEADMLRESGIHIVELDV